MDATGYQVISMVGFGLAALFLLIAIILFFAFDVVALYGEVSGKTADKQVKEIRENNKKAVRRREPEKSGRLEKSSKQIAKGIFEGSNLVVTEPIVPKVQPSAEVQTDVLRQTTAAKEEETTVLEEGTTILKEDTSDANHSELIMLEDDIEIHTDETI